MLTPRRAEGNSLTAFMLNVPRDEWAEFSKLVEVNRRILPRTKRARSASTRALLRIANVLYVRPDYFFQGYAVTTD